MDLLVAAWADPEEVQDVLPMSAVWVVWVHVPPVPEGLACATQLSEGAGITKPLVFGYEFRSCHCP